MNSCCSLSRVNASTAANGSSSSSSRGFSASARAMPDALRHAARQLARVRVLEVGEADGIEEAVRRRLRIAARMARACATRSRRSGAPSSTGKAPAAGTPCRGDSSGPIFTGAPSQYSAPLRRSQQSCREAEQRALAAARRSDDARDAAGRYAERHVVQHVGATPARQVIVKDVIDDELAAVRANRSPALRALHAACGRRARLRRESPSSVIEPRARQPADQRAHAGADRRR